MTTITLNKGGTAETQVELDSIQVADLWHVAMKLADAGDKPGSQAVLDTWHLAHDLVRHIRELEPVAHQGTWDACPECGCTDVEVSAWVNANTHQVINGEGPTDNAWCPQCEVGGLDGNMRSRDLEQVETACPFDKDRLD